MFNARKRTSAVGRDYYDSGAKKKKITRKKKKTTTKTRARQGEQPGLLSLHLYENGPRCGLIRIKRTKNDKIAYASKKVRATAAAKTKKASCRRERNYGPVRVRTQAQKDAAKRRRKQRKGIYNAMNNDFEGMDNDYLRRIGFI